jgi:hypothetical protein
MAATTFTQESASLREHRRNPLHLFCLLIRPHMVQPFTIATLDTAQIAHLCDRPHTNRLRHLFQRWDREGRGSVAPAEFHSSRLHGPTNIGSPWPIGHAARPVGADIDLGRDGSGARRSGGGCGATQDSVGGDTFDGDLLRGGALNKDVQTAGGGALCNGAALCAGALPDGGNTVVRLGVGLASVSV